MPTIRATTSKRSLSTALVMAWQSFYRDAFNTYRPELHYMRGPGPKWHAKHTTPASAPPSRRRRPGPKPTFFL